MLIITISSAFWSTKCQLDIKAYTMYTIRLPSTCSTSTKKKNILPIPLCPKGTEYTSIPNPNEMQTVINAYAYALQGCSLSLIAVNSAMKAETILRQPKNPSCKVEFNQPSYWLYSVPNLLVFQHLVTLYLGGFIVRVVSEIEC